MGKTGERKKGRVSVPMRQAQVWFGHYRCYEELLAECREWRGRRGEGRGDARKQQKRARKWAVGESIMGMERNEWEEGEQGPSKGKAITVKR